MGSLKKYSYMSEFCQVPEWTGGGGCGNLKADIHRVRDSFVWKRRYHLQVSFWDDLQGGGEKKEGFFTKPKTLVNIEISKDCDYSEEREIDGLRSAVEPKYSKDYLLELAEELSNTDVLWRIQRCHVPKHKNNWGRYIYRHNSRHWHKIEDRESRSRERCCF